MKFCNGLWRTAGDVKRRPDVKEFYIGFLGFLRNMNDIMNLVGVKEFYDHVNMLYSTSFQSFWYSLFCLECVVTNMKSPTKIRSQG